MIKRVVAAVSFSATVVLMGSAAMAAPSISNTGYKSKNKITVKNVQVCNSLNTNILGVDNSTSQGSSSGNAKVSHNTTGGNAVSGNAGNTATTTTGATLTNNSACDMGVLTVAPDAAAADGTIGSTGSHSLNVIATKNVNKVTVVNNNFLTVSNSTSQSASSGNAEVHGNTTGGNATSGPATNTATTTTTLVVTNN